MSRLRPGTALGIAGYPETPVRYHRPFLRLVAAAFLVGEAVLSISLTYFPEGKGDDLTGGDWWIHLLMLGILGGLYLYVASSLVVTRTQVIVRNPFRTAKIPLDQITTAAGGSNLRIHARHRDFVAAGVEAANVQMQTDTFGTQADLATLITKAAAAAPEDDTSPPAKYHFAWPDPLFLTFALINLTNAAVTFLNNGALQ